VTTIDFHTGAADKLVYAARLLRKAYASGAQVTVTGPRRVLDQFDARLWTFSQLDFIPHVFADSRLAGQTPILLSDNPKQSPAHEVLVNLGDSIPDGFARYARLIEIVGADEADRHFGRDRYKHYRDRGYALSVYEVPQSSA
jgi:DNA polymerase III subunit chi